MGVRDSIAISRLDFDVYRPSGLMQNLDKMDWEGLARFAGPYLGHKRSSVAKDIDNEGTKRTFQDPGQGETKPASGHFTERKYSLPEGSVSS